MKRVKHTSSPSILGGLASAVLVCLAGQLSAQQPISAIDWLDAPPVDTVPGAGNGTDVPDLPIDNWQLSLEPLWTPEATDGSLGAPAIVVEPLAQSSAEAVGLLAPSTTGLPLSLWRASSTDSLINQLENLPADPLPAMRALYYTLLLAETDPPLDSGNSARFLQARIATLIRAGAVAQAYALIERAGPARPELFDQWLDLSILTGEEDAACAALIQRPGLSTSYAARIYCQARGGDWMTAALTHETASAIGTITQLESNLLLLYLDPEMIEAMPDIPPPRTITPIVFRLFEAAGTPLPTRQLPRAFAMADLRGNAGWKAEIEAAERLARTRALPANRLLGFYTAHKAAASGGVWTRVRALQRLDRALMDKDPERIADALPPAWEAMRAEGLGIAFAELFGLKLTKIDLPEDAATLAFRIGLLSPDYEMIADARKPANEEEAFLIGLAQGRIRGKNAQTPLQTMIAEAFLARGAADEYRPRLDRGQLGEVILAAAKALDEARSGDQAMIGSALRTLRAVNLEDTARRAALQLVLLKPQS